MKNVKTAKCDNKKLIPRVLLLVIMDIVIISLSAFLALLTRFDFSISTGAMEFLSRLEMVVPFFVLFSIVVYIPLKLYNSLWEFAGVEELLRIVAAVAIICLAQVLAILGGLLALPRSFPVLNACFQVAFTLASRFFYRFARSLHHRSMAGKLRKRTMVIGAGSAGMVILREFQTSECSQNQVVCVVDDDLQKRGAYLRNVKICGGRNDIPRLVEEYRVEEIIFAIPTASVAERKEILTICQKTNCRLKTLPGIFQLANGEVSIQKLRDVDVADLLGRDSVRVDNSQIAELLRGKTVLVTGGGGSIGSELCRQIAAYGKVDKLIIFDIYENNAYEIQQELRRSHPELRLVTLIGSVRDTARVEDLFATWRPHVVFHAAAHKHVPLMEDSPNEAIKNNVFGTYHVAAAADRFGVESFVLISTDKAVNPTNIMGASKRICEMIVQTMAQHSKTKFVAVRFGNVLGSNGSVIPLFKRQIAEGGPVLVTHPDIIRYFMTIPEAVSLVLQASAYAKRGEIFVLDMGEPVRIADLARNLIRLSGFEPDVDIEIKYTGLRPGEKLFEEMLMNEEGLQSTDNHLIHIGKPLEIREEQFTEQLKRLDTACNANSADIAALVAEIVPTYHRPAGVC